MRSVSTSPPVAPEAGRLPASGPRRWPVTAVVLLSFSSGLPLGLVWIAVPAWMALEGFDIKVIGLFTLVQAPWSLKPLWSPLIDRYAPPFLGRKRGWVLVSQVVLVALGLGLAAAAEDLRTAWIIAALTLATAFASASQDIAYDGYVVEVLRKEEYGPAVGWKTAMARAAMFISGRVSISLAGATSWMFTHGVLALLYLPFMVVTWLAPEPEKLPTRPKSLREAVWGPFMGFLGQHRALEILSFVVLYKLSDNLTQALTAPFLVQKGYNEFDIGVAIGSVGLATMLIGTYVGAKWCERLGLGRALWIFGLLQIVSNLGYALVASIEVNRPIMYASQAFEMGSSGLGTGAFSVLLLRLTQKRFSATQYALLSSLFALPRIFSGPPVALMADALGWRDFFISTVLFGLPGLWMLGRFVPWRVRDPRFHVAAPRRGRALSAAQVSAWAAFSGVVCSLAAGLAVAGLEGVKAYRAGVGFDPVAHAAALLRPATLSEGFTTLGLGIFGLLAALAVAAALTARHRANPMAESE